MGMQWELLHVTKSPSIVPANNPNPWSTSEVAYSAGESTPLIDLLHVEEQTPMHAAE